MPRKPEVLAPAGDEAALRAALEAGADAVYFGLSDGFNARARARNFDLQSLPATVDLIHRAGARAYLTLNTLIFQSELPFLERILRGALEAGVDALIVQDPAVALMARALDSTVELHASTQMTISSALGARFAETLGITRIVLPRELSTREIRELARDTSLELEVFVMGALCVSWSGQCLSSEAWGGRSANRGQCAQACRLPYELMVDGVQKPLGDVAYLLSPKDLAGFRAIHDLVDIGVHTLKIEGRQKGASYVQSAVGSMRRWVDAVMRGVQPADEQQLAVDLRDLQLAYSRGFSDGWLAGSDHQTLVEGRFPRHRGIYLGRVAEVRHDAVRIDTRPEPERKAVGEVSSPLPPGPAPAALEVKSGMGVVFDVGRPEEPEEGGPIFAVERSNGQLWLRFGRPGPNLQNVPRRARVWVTGDPIQGARAQKATTYEPEGRLPLHLKVAGALGQPLQLHGRGVTVQSQTPLQAARGEGLETTLQEKIGALGGTLYHLASLDMTELQPGLFLPTSELKALRRALIEQLSHPTVRRTLPAEPVLPRLLGEPQSMSDAPPRLIPLCRTPEQLEAVIEAGQPEVVLDWMELVGLGTAVERARTAGLKIGIATVRVQKPGEAAYDQRIQKLQPDALLVRHWAGVMHFHGRTDRPEVHGDFSLNVTNAITAMHLLNLGLDTVTVSHDLDAAQVMALLEGVPAHRMAVTVHHHIPTFHTEHCVYSNLLSNGRDYRTCGRPCEKHKVALKDRVGLEHPVIVDVGCRNTVFNASAQTAASLVPRLLEGGVRTFRIEFVWENRQQTRTVLEAYRGLLAGRLAPAEVVRRVGTHEQYGVTRGTMETMV